MVISITNATYVENYIIKLNFDDGKTIEMDFGPFLKKSLNPMTTQFLDILKFKNFRIDYGDLVWGDYEMCFPIWDLFEGKI